MCVVSMVIDQGRQLPYDQWTLPGVFKFEELVNTAREFDEATGQADCEDPEKALFFKELKKIKKRLKRIEKELKKVNDG